MSVDMADASIDGPSVPALAGEPPNDAVNGRAMSPATEKWLAWAAPYLFGILFLGGWEAFVRIKEIPPYLLPGPILIVQTLVTDFSLLLPNLIVTLRTTVLAFLAAAIGGLLLGLLFTLSRWIERTLFPYAVILQVTPIVAIAPLIIIWSNDTQIALLICAWIVAFFPIVSNTAVGLNSTDRNLIDLYRLYGASRTQTLLLLKLPSALPYYLAGLRISGGLALIGAVVAEFVAGTGGTQSGLAYRILESGYRLEIPRMFAALLLISVSGITIFACLSLLSRFLLRNWHESATGE
jgi:NitT/TauT family transport system permease protein